MKMFRLFVSEEIGSFEMIEKIQIENAARGYGLPDAELFQTVDLFEKRNIAQVTQCIHALGRQVKHPVDISLLHLSCLDAEKEFQWTDSRSENGRCECSRIYRRTTTCRTEYGRFIERWDE